MVTCNCTKADKSIIKSCIAIEIGFPVFCNVCTEMFELWMWGNHIEGALKFLTAGKRKWFTLEIFQKTIDNPM